MKKGSVLILGARSDIGMAVAHRFAQAGYDIQLAARQAFSLDDARSDLQVRNSVMVTLHEFDALNSQSHEAFVTDITGIAIDRGLHSRFYGRAKRKCGQHGVCITGYAQ